MDFGMLDLTTRAIFLWGDLIALGMLGLGSLLLIGTFAHHLLCRLCDRGSQPFRRD